MRLIAGASLGIHILLFFLLDGYRELTFRVGLLFPHGQWAAPRHRASAAEASPGLVRAAMETEAEPGARGQGEGLGQYIQKILLVEIRRQRGKLQLNYHTDAHALERLTATTLGRRILFTDNHQWTAEEIILAYRSQRLRLLGAPVSLDRSEDPRSCSLLRDGPDPGRAAAPRSPPGRSGTQSGDPLSGTVVDLRSHQSLCPDSGKCGPPSCGHHVHTPSRHAQAAISPKFSDWTIARHVSNYVGRRFR